MLCHARFEFFPGTLLAGLILAGSLSAAEPQAVAAVVAQEDRPPIVDLFDSIETGNIDAKVFPRSEKHVNLLLENKTSEPILVSVPAALGVVPVMAQFDQFPWPPGDQNQGQQRPQNVVAGPQWQGGRNGANQARNNPWNVPGAALFSVPPENTIKVGLTGICLDHGLPLPRPKMPYELRPIHDVAVRPEIAALCTMLGKGEVGQTTAQLAAWHFQNKMSWEDLVAISKKTAIGPRAEYTPAQIQSAKAIASAAEKLAKEMQSSQASESPVSMR